MKTSLWRASYYQEWLIPLVSSAFYVHMFLLHLFFCLKEKVSTKETIEQQLQSIFSILPPWMKHKLRPALYLLIQFTAGIWLYIQRRSSIHIEFLFCPPVLLHSIWSEVFSWVFRKVADSQSVYASVISIIHMGVSEVRLKVLISSRVTRVSGCSIRSTQRAVAWANAIALVGPGPQTFPSRAFTLASSGVITLSNNHTSSLIPQLCHGARESHGTVCSAEPQQAYGDFCPSTHYSLYTCKMC